MRKLSNKKIDINHQHHHGDDHDGDELVLSRPSKRQRLVNDIITSSTNLLHPTKLCQWLLHKFLPACSASSQELVPSNNRNLARPDHVVQPNKYDVFISFRGVDVRNSFLSHLYSHLNDVKKFAVYKDDVDMERGEQISPTLLQAIERSDVYILIISPNYMDSPWCLEELVKILECKERYGRRIIPVFYGVDPSYVDNPKLPSSTSGKIQSWSAALEEIANHSGFNAQLIRPETKLIEEIVIAVFQAIRRSSQIVTFSSYSASRGLVGVERKMEQVQELLCLRDRSNRTIGLWGMAGIGKTVLAKAFFDLFSCQFEASYFFSNFAHALASGLSQQPFGNLQNDFFSKLLGDENGRAGGTLSYDLMLHRLGRMKALVVIDDVGNDVGNIGPLKDLLNGQYCDLFGPGSVIIMTSRNKQLLKSVCHTLYEVEALHDEEARQLFCLHAFREASVQTEYLEVVGRAVDYVDGNPLASTVLGAHLFGRDLKFWDRELGALQDNDPNSVVQNVVRRSYDDLSRAEKDVFLDFACFYDYWGHVKLEIIEEMFLEGGRGNLITNLVDKSLISIHSGSYIKIEMNRLLQDLGRRIVNEECQIERRSRLWKPKDVYYLFGKNKCTQSIEGILYRGKQGAIYSLKPDTFAKMENLRFLVIGPDACNLILPEDGLKCLPNALSILVWIGFGSKCLPSQFSAENLVRLDLRNSKIEQLWEGDELNALQDLGNLKFLLLHESRSLRKLSDLSTAKRLKEIYLNECESLVELPTSILDLPKLESLNVWHCSSLKLDNLEYYANSSREHSSCHSDILPNLKKLNLSGTPIKKVPNFITRLHILDLQCLDCTKLTEFPVVPSLEELTLTGSLIEEMVELDKLTELKRLILSKNEKLVLISGDFSKLKSLKKIHLDDCSKLHSLPDSVGNLIHLEILDLSFTAFEELPSSIGDLTGLSKLLLTGCKSLACLPDTIHKLSNLQILELDLCDQLRHLPELPSPLRNLDARGCKSLQTLSIGKVEKHDLTNTDWCFAQCWKLDPAVCNKLVDKFAQDSLRIFGHSSLLLPAKCGSESGGEAGSTMGMGYNSNTMVTVKLRGQPWKSKSTIFCALLNPPDPLLNNKDYDFLVECVMLNNKDIIQVEVVVSACDWEPFGEYEDQEERLSNRGHFLIWSTSRPLVAGENVDDGSTLEFMFRGSYRTNDGFETYEMRNMVKNCRVIPVYNDRVVTNEEEEEEEEEEESPNDLQGLYDQLCAHG